MLDRSAQPERDSIGLPASLVVLASASACADDVVEMRWAQRTCTGVTVVARWRWSVSMLQISEPAFAMPALARQHQEAIWACQLTVNRLRSVSPPRVPSEHLGCIPDLDPQGGTGGPKRRRHSGHGPQAHPRAGRHAAVAQRESDRLRPGRRHHCQTGAARLASATSG